ncbi:MauE/DoxX family redox-associated membrane protein [Chryseobacterium sp. W4I1]|uniref:MauE/DoxX family redox-associated membrane protein n=1 Tax=Chryseobacterium sp. W4I1 TaxID=3042293 RepID=UPI002786CCF6|nr:MauE/DoxX family redox-associated membrane protein [Chryseobacterium sp. W4I1]MDQ0781365.1 putative membrane protein YphA (DoxX/SURF4 family) [Chryseobacterium sp. W4I1]
MKKIADSIPTLTAYFFVLLFCYAGISKVLDFENFQVQIAQSPLLSAFAGFTSYSVIAAELIIVSFLLVPRLRTIGLYASMGIMTAFTIYIYLILNYSDFVPCSCGGILEKMGWTEHLIFNIICVLLSLAAVIIIERQTGTAKLKYILSSAAVIVSSSILVIILFLQSEHIIKKENNFTRKFLPNFLMEAGKKSLNHTDYYFAGTDAENLYLGRRGTPLILTEIDHKLKNMTTTKISLDHSDHPFKSLQIKVRAPYLYLYDGTVPVIYRGHLKDSIARTISKGDAYFSQLAVKDSSDFILRTQDSRTHQYTIARLKIAQKSTTTLFPSILEKQIDGIFDCDGMLIENQQHREEFIYVYFYRNQFIIIGNDLPKVKRQSSIDSIFKAQVKITRLSNGTNIMNAPPVRVNLNAAFYGNHIYNVSGLPGKFEPARLRKGRKAVDIYRTDKGEYIGSFYLPAQKIDDVIVTRHGLYLISGKELLSYQFRKSL